MGYRIWSEEEKNAFNKLNNKNIIKSSIEIALATAATIVACKYAGSLNIQELSQKIIVILGGIGLIGVDMHSVMNFCIKLMEGDSIKNGYTNLYDEEDIKGRRI